MKTIAIILGLGLIVVFNTACSSHMDVGPQGDRHGVATSVGKSGAHAKAY